MSKIDASPGRIFLAYPSPHTLQFSHVISDEKLYLSSGGSLDVEDA